MLLQFHINLPQLENELYLLCKNFRLDEKGELFNNKTSLHPLTIKEYVLEHIEAIIKIPIYYFYQSQGKNQTLTMWELVDNWEQVESMFYKFIVNKQIQFSQP